VPLTPDQAATTLERLATELDRRRSKIETLDNAYRGEQRLQFASEDFRDFFADRYAKFADNWCGVVADAPHERLEITGIRIGSDDDKDLFDAWRRTDADQQSDLGMLDAIISGRSFALVWGDRDGRPVVTFEHPSQAIVAYDPETRARKAGAKVWADEVFEYATLYLPDEVWKFKRDRVRMNHDPERAVESAPRLSGGWDLRDEGVIPNPLGKVPLVEWQNRPRLLGEPHSDIEGALGWQHAINLLWSELFAVADEATIGQRLIIGAEMPTVAILDENGNEVGERPIDLKKWRRDRLGWLEDPTASVHQWQPAQLEPFTKVVEIAVGHVAAQSRTPAHYLLVGGTIANVSGDAMKALETGLVKRTLEKTQHFGRAARDVFELIALVTDDAGKAEAVRSGTVLWKDVENRSDAQVSDAALKDRDIGLPLRYILEKRHNLPPAEIERVIQMVRDEQSDPFALLDPATRAALKASRGDADAAAGA
jgi:hypothetical protein